MTEKLIKNTCKRVVLALLAVSLLSGCNPARSSLATFNSHFESAGYGYASQFARKKIGAGKTPSGDDLLWTLQAAATERAQTNHSQSIADFDRAEDMLKYYDEQSAELVDTVGSAAVNENLVPYKGHEYDGIMVNTYKALDFMAQKNNDLARVELNRALDRQIRAREHFNEEVRKLEAKLKKRKRRNSSDVNAMASDPAVADRIAAQYPDLDQFQPYPDFVNPFTTYLAAIFFEISGDYEKAAYLFKESYGMVPDNDYIAKDLTFTDDLTSGKTKLENIVWVIFENGLGPVKEEIRVDLPLLLASNRVFYTGVALPRLVPRYPAYSCLMVQTDTGDYQTRQIADMERVIRTEFKKDFKGILTKAIASAVGKAAAQAALSNQGDNGGVVLAALVGVYSAATTAADVRIWSALPKDFQVARCAIPESRKLRIAPPGAATFEIDIPACKNAILYIKIVHAGATPVYEVLTF